MNQLVVKFVSVKIQCLVLAFFVSFSLFFPESALAKVSAKKFIKIDWNPTKTAIIIKAVVYDYNERISLNYGFIDKCRIQFTENGQDWHDLLVITTPRQRQTNLTEVYLLNKFKNAQIYLVGTPKENVLWPESLNAKKEAVFKNEGDKCEIGFYWHLVNGENIKTMRVIGTWHHAEVSMAETLNDGVYELKKTKKPILTGINEEASENDAINVFKESDEIVIQGANPGENIKVYNTSGIEVKSVVSNNDVVKIKLPPNQVYSVHVGNSEYKVAM